MIRPQVDKSGLSGKQSRIETKARQLRRSEAGIVEAVEDVALRTGARGFFSARLENANLVEGARKSLSLKWLAHDDFKYFSNRTDGELLRQKREYERVIFDAVAKIL